MKGAVLFDLDQTLMDRSLSLRAFCEWQANGMLRDQIETPEKFVERFIELDANGSVWKDRVYENLIAEFSINHWSVTDLLECYQLTFCAFSCLRQGVLPALKFLDELDVPTGIVTNGFSPFQERNIRTLCIEKYISAVIVSDAVGLRKPDRKIFELGCKELGATISESVFIGDNPIADIRGAKQAGLKTVYVPVASHNDYCEEADETVLDLDNLPDAIKRLLS